MRVLGVDLGIKKTGLAVSDELGLAVRPLPNLVPKSRAQDIEYLARLCTELGVEIVVIGDPIMPESETEGPMAKRARGFAAALREKINVPVVLQDERMTSKDAQKRLVEMGVKKTSRKQKRDAEVACLLVEEYLALHMGSGFE